MRSRRAPTIVDAALTLGAHHAVAMPTRRGYVPAMGETSLMTAEELLRLYLPDKRTELIRGRLVVRDPGGARHGALANRIGYRITAHVEARDLGRVYAAETGFKIESDPDTVRAPDVAFIAKARLPQVEPLGYPNWAPDLAVEVLAHDDHPAETLEKVAHWLRAGVRLIWVVDAHKRNDDPNESNAGSEPVRYLLERLGWMVIVRQYFHRQVGRPVGIAQRLNLGKACFRDEGDVRRPNGVWIGLDLEACLRSVDPT